MDNENTSLDKLFSKKFENYESQSSKADWDKLSIKLNKLNFLKFSLSTFNVYFLAVFVSMALATAYLGINNRNKSEKIEVLEGRIDSLQNQVNEIAEIPYEKDTTTIKKMTYAEENVITPTIERGSSENKESELDIKPIVPNTDSVKVKQKETIIASADSSVTTQKRKTPKIRKVKKTIRVKQEDVILKDTVVIKKKGK